MNCPEPSLEPPEDRWGKACQKEQAAQDEGDRKGHEHRDALADMLLDLGEALIRMEKERACP